jgi:hypothetical protein
MINYITCKPGSDGVVSVMGDISIIKHKLDLLSHEGMGIGLNPCLEETQVREFEEKQQIDIPEDYRNFLLSVGDGGAGPNGSIMLPLRFIPYHSCGHCRDLDFFRKPFPHTYTWHIEWDRKRFPEEYLYEEAYDRLEHTQGAFSFASVRGICHYLLIISGTERGNIWYDGRPESAGISPLLMVNGTVEQADHIRLATWDETGGSHIDFFTWYNSWVDTKLSTGS